MPLNQTSGNVTTDAYGGGVAAQVKYIENYFQTWLRTGTGASATVTTGLDASTNKALVWTKSRSAATDHKLTDTVRGATKALISDTTGAQTTDTNGLTAFSSTGYTIGTDTNYNNSGATYVDWEFVATPKFFDVVTYTGNGLSSNVISHNLGSVPGFIICKRTDSTSGWAIWHRGNGTTSYGLFALNSTAAATANFSAAPTSTTFDAYNIWDTGNPANASGGTYIAYLFAHNAGGFGLTGTDNVISCGSFTTDGSSNADVTLGYEPQWIITKDTQTAVNWYVADIMRDMSNTNSAYLIPNTSSAEILNGSGVWIPTATGLKIRGLGSANKTHIYIAIRRGPMKVPTDATKVFLPISTPPSTTVTVGFVPDFSITKQTDNGVGSSSATYAGSRLQGNSVYLSMSSTAVEGAFGWQWNDPSTKFTQTSSGTPVYSELFGRAPSFFDEVCYTGTGSATAISHNLGAVPELMIVKNRGTVVAWKVYHSAIGNTNFLELNSTGASTASTTIWNDTTPTSSMFTVGSGVGVNQSGVAQVAYLFATCAGVSKVGSYTGTGATQTISCGFTGGARFVLIKRTDSTGNWWYWDTTRGMVASNDQRMPINDTTVQANANWVYTTTGGFQIVTTDASVNASGGSYLFFAVA